MGDGLINLVGNIEVGIVLGSEITYGWKMIQELGNNDYDLIILKRSKTIFDKVLRKAKINSIFLEKKEGRKHTEEEKQTMSNLATGKQIGENNGFYGRQHTEETKEIIRKKRLAYLEAKRNINAD